MINKNISQYSEEEFKKEIKPIEDMLQATLLWTYCNDVMLYFHKTEQNVTDFHSISLPVWAAKNMLEYLEELYYKM